MLVEFVSQNSTVQVNAVDGQRRVGKIRRVSGKLKRVPPG